MKNINFEVDENGFYGNFGGAFVPDALMKNIKELSKCFNEIHNTPEFKNEYESLLRDYVGRPSPLYYAKRLSERHGAKIYLKREDLNHTGSHKINNTLGQILLAKHMGKKTIIAETGAGQHGVATATACALMNLNCIVFMGALDMQRQFPNVQRMRMLGAKVIAAESGTKTLSDAVNEALAYWVEHTDTFYLLGSAVGPHPYPNMVTTFQSIISKEIKKQLQEKEGRENPDYVFACIGGGSNATGAFHEFIGSPEVHLVGVEAGGMGVETGKSAAALLTGVEKVLHGSRSYVMCDKDGNIREAFSISAGLDYPGVGPLLAHMKQVGRLEVKAATDTEALDAAFELTHLEGIIPAIESSHALAALNMFTFKPDDVVVVNLSGRGDKDMEEYLKRYAMLVEEEVHEKE
ncbi:MAG: tryptophan synthase subunit beta [Rikenellaceae bacterium]